MPASIRSLFLTLTLIVLTSFGFVVTSAEAHTLTATALLPDGTPAGRATVEFYAADGSVQLAVTDRQGNFSLDDLTPGTYILNIATLRQDFAYLNTLVVTENMGSQSFTLAETGAIAGSVNGCDASCVVNITFNDVSMLVQELEADGSFEIDGLAAATYEITVYAADRATVPQNVTVAVGEQLAVALTLS